MEPSITLVMAAASLLFLLLIIHLVKHDRLQLRYSLIWLCFGLFIIACALFPKPLFFIGSLFGFSVSSNFVFACIVFFLLLICLLLSSIASKQAVALKNITQRLSIVERELLAQEEGQNRAI